MAPTSVAAQDAPCSDEAYRKFAALEGEWDSIWLARNQLVGRYRFDRESGGCALRQSWTGAPATPGTGLGLIAYSPADRMWHRFWTDDTGTFETMTASAEGPETRWEGDRTDPQDRSRTIGIRIAWRANPDGSILETYHISRDGRQSWTPFGRFLLRRVEPGAD